MTTPDESRRSLENAGQFLLDLATWKYDQVPLKVSEIAKVILRHYPTRAEIVTKWKDLEDLSLIMEKAQAKQREKDARIADAEPELPGLPSEDHLAVIMHDPVISLRATVRVTKKNIAAAIRSQGEEGKA